MVFAMGEAVLQPLSFLRTRYEDWFWLSCDGGNKKIALNVILLASSLSYRRSLILASAMKLSCTRVAQ